MTKEQKERIVKAVNEKINEHFKRGVSIDDTFTVMIPEMIVAAIEEYDRPTESALKAE